MQIKENKNGNSLYNREKEAIYRRKLYNEHNIQIGNNIKNNHIIASNSKYITYSGNWYINLEGNFVNGATYQTKDSILEYIFNGTATAIFSTTDTTINIKIDNGRWKEYKVKGNSKQEPSIVISNLNNAEHKVEIEVITGLLNLNLISTDGEFVKYDNSKNFIIGDINQDGKLNKIDLLLLKMQIIGLNSLFDYSLKGADINNDGVINLVDLSCLKAML